MERGAIAYAALARWFANEGVSGGAVRVAGGSITFADGCELQQNMAKYGARKQAGERDEEAAPTGASKTYKPPPKPQVRAPTVSKTPGPARARGAAGGAGGGEPSMARLRSPKKFVATGGH